MDTAVICVCGHATMDTAVICVCRHVTMDTAVICVCGHVTMDTAVVCVCGHVTMDTAVVCVCGHVTMDTAIVLYEDSIRFICRVIEGSRDLQPLQCFVRTGPHQAKQIYLFGSSHPPIKDIDSK